MSEPPDGWTPEERFLMRDFVLSLYKKINDPIDKFIVMAVYEAGYTQTEVAIMFGISQVAINHRLLNTVKKIKEKREKGTL